MISGTLQKLSGKIDESGIVQYYLPIGNEDLHLNPYLGTQLCLTFTGEICCQGCGRKIKKSYQQGYCFPCTQTLAACDLCIVRPERCHFHHGTCREPEWATAHCMIPHVVYLANTSGLKVGITRENQIPNRWIDQGAIQAIPFAKTHNRYLAGLLEVELAKSVNDKTDWRKMLKGNIERIDLEEKRKYFEKPALEFIENQSGNREYAKIELLQECNMKSIQYPFLDSAAQLEKIVALNLDKLNNLSGKLIGIKGQYLIFDIGVLNCRNIAGYNIKIEKL